VKPPLRADLDSLVAYMAPQVEAPVRLNTNECAYPPPKVFAVELAEAVGRIPFNRYPDHQASALRAGLAELTGHPAEGIWAANGSNEVIQQLCLAYGGSGRRALVFTPSYSMHELIPRMVGMGLTTDPLPNGFGLTAEEGEKCVRAHRPDITFICSPNNPTGNAQPREAVVAICEATEGLVIVDEAYVEFGAPSVAPLVARFEHLVVVRTFSKAFSLAAARIGYLLAAPAVVDDLARVRLPYHLSSLAQTAGQVALRHARQAVTILEALRLERDRIVSSLAAMTGVDVYPSQANFVMFRTERDAAALWRALLTRGVLVRDVSGAPALERCLRVTAGTPDEVSAFLEALPLALEDAA
jgi:histidinol-phosphate aminotransferase